jgi:GNAT superfamily N-acetyltransferase
MILEAQQQEIEFQLATPEDAVDMVTFHNSYYGENRKPEFWLWEYQKYEPGKAVFAFAKDHDKIIATQAMAPIYMAIGSDCVLAGRIENTLILPQYRGTGVMKNLWEYAERNSIDRGMQFVWGFSDAVKAYENFGCTCYPDIKVLFRPGNIWLGLLTRLQSEAPLWRRIGSAVIFLLRSVFVINIRTIPKIREEEGYEIRKGRIDDQHLIEFYERVKSKYKSVICIKYDQKYLSWRVREHPFFKYDEYQVYQGTILRAYAFVVLSDRTAHISDLLSDDSYATSLLLHTILKDYAKKVGQFRFLGNPKDILAQDSFNQLHQFGFRGYNWNLILEDLAGGKYQQIFDMRNWHITGLWTEGYKC